MNLREFYENKNILIIGADSDLGISVAREFSKYKVNLFLTSNKIDVVKNMEKEIINSKGFRADICEEDSIRTLISRIDHEYGDLDYIVNLTDYELNKPFSVISKREVNNLVKVNIEASMMLVQYVLKYYSEKDCGCYVQKSRLLTGEFSADNAVKAAVSALCKSLRREYFHYNIKLVMFYSTSDNRESARSLVEEMAMGKNNIVAGNMVEKGIGLIDTLYQDIIYVIYGSISKKEKKVKENE